VFEVTPSVSTPSVTTATDLVHKGYLDSNMPVYLTAFAEASTGVLTMTFSRNPTTKIVQKADGTTIAAIWAVSSGNTWTCTIAASDLADYMIIYY